MSERRGQPGRGTPTVTTAAFGHCGEGEIRVAHLDAGGPVRASVINYGARLHSLVAPDRHGEPGECLLGFDTAEGYLADTEAVGAVIGRIAGRVPQASLRLGDARYSLDRNAGEHHIHGGRGGFHQRLWALEPWCDGDRAGVRLTLNSPDGDQGFPGALAACVDYALSPDGALTVTLAADTDRPTAVNMTHHAYFDLGGRKRAADHYLRVAAASFQPVDTALFPAGPFRALAGTPLDLRERRLLADVLASDDSQIRLADGVDHCYRLDGTGLRDVAWLDEPASGRRLTVATTQPALQVYTGQNLTGAPGRHGPLAAGSGVCLEAQAPPADADGALPETSVLRPEATYRQTIRFAFDVAG